MKSVDDNIGGKMVQRLVPPNEPEKLTLIKPIISQFIRGPLTWELHKCFHLVRHTIRNDPKNIVRWKMQ